LFEICFNRDLRAKYVKLSDKMIKPVEKIINAKRTKTKHRLMDRFLSCLRSETVDENVENKEAVEEFHEKVEGEEHGAVNVVIENEMPECIACRACEAQCPHEALEIIE
jgi:formate hydrogenlyase subunit 6/NADH:ubiquinone oxidoreductase subunit I